MSHSKDTILFMGNKFEKARSAEEQRKTRYFNHLALSVKDAFKLHKNAGRLWEKKEGGTKRSWGNVSEHCLVEVARTDVFADFLGLPKDAKKDLMLAAALHDFNKRNDVEMMAQSSAGKMEKLTEAGARSDIFMEKAGFSDRIIKAIHGLEDQALPKAEKIAQKESLSPDDLIYLVMHYVDDYTRNAEWVRLAEKGKDGILVNDLDRRIDALEANPQYKQLNEEGRAIFNGKTTFQAQRQVAKMIEKRIAEIMSQHIGRTVDPITLPELIDTEIKKRIHETY